MIMTENHAKQPYKIVEDPTGLYDYDSHNLNLLGFQNDVPMLTLQPNKPNIKDRSNRRVNGAAKLWNGKKLVIKRNKGINNKLVQYKNKNKVELCRIPSSSINVNSSPDQRKLNYHVYKVQKANCNPIISECSNNVASDHNYFTARRKSSELISLLETSVDEVKQNRSLSMSLHNIGDPKKIVDKPLTEYKVYSRNQNDSREDLTCKPLPKPVEALKIVKIIKPHSSISPPPLEVIRPMANKVYHNRKITLPKVDGCSQTTSNSTTTIGVNTDENMFNDFIEAKAEELRIANLDLDTELESCLKNWDMFICNDEFPNPLLNVQKNGKMMDTNITNGSYFNAVGQSSNSTPMHWKMQLFSDLKKCDIIDMSGNRPLHLAVMQNNDRLVKRNCIALKARAIDINFTNNENLTALQLALMHNADLAVVETLLLNNCDTLANDSEGNNILHLAVLYSNEDVVRLLVSTPDLCDANACNFEGYTPLILCVINKRYVMADFLLSFDADPNIGDKKSGRTALFHAVEANDAEMVKLLINQKALTKVKNYFGTSPHDAMFELDSIDATIRKLVLNRDDVSSARPKIARGKRKRNGGGGGDRPKIYKP